MRPRPCLADLDLCLRHSPAGRLFGIGWDAANLLARKALHNRLMTWAFEGCRETVTRVDVETTHRDKPNQRVMLAMLTKLEEQAKDYGPDELMAARLIAQRFDHYLGFIDAADIDGAIGFVAEGLARPYEDASLRALERARDRLREQAAAAAETCHNPPACKLHETAAGDEATAEGTPEPRHSPPTVILREPAARDGAAAGGLRAPRHSSPARKLHEPVGGDGGTPDEPRRNPPAHQPRVPADGDEVEQPTGSRKTAFERQHVQHRADAPAADQAEPQGHGLRFPALIVTALAIEPDGRIVGVRLADVVARDTDPAIRRRAEEQTRARLRTRSRAPLPAPLAELRGLAPDRKPLLCERPAIGTDPGLHALYVRRNADGELPAITAATPERNCPACMGD